MYVDVRKKKKKVSSIHDTEPKKKNWLLKADNGNQLLAAER